MELNKKIVGFDFERPKVKPVSLILNTVSVNAAVRPLRVTWSPELTQDLEAYHNIDVEAELTTFLSEQVGQEIDRLIMNGLIGTPQPNENRRTYEAVGFDRFFTDHVTVPGLINVCRHHANSDIIKYRIKQFNFVKPFSMVNLPRVARVFS